MVEGASWNSWFFTLEGYPGMSRATGPPDTSQSCRFPECLWGYFPLSESMCLSRACSVLATPHPSGLIGTMCHVQAHLVLLCLIDVAFFYKSKAGSSASNKDYESPYCNAHIFCGGPGRNLRYLHNVPVQHVLMSLLISSASFSERTYNTINFTVGQLT